MDINVLQMVDSYRAWLQGDRSKKEYREVIESLLDEFELQEIESAHFSEHLDNLSEEDRALEADHARRLDRLEQKYPDEGTA